jgi:hypothetical protein
MEHRPEGRVATAPALEVTFNQPMVPVASLEELANISVPIHLTPPIDGKWRWLETNTATFVPSFDGGRFPMSAEYAIEVPAGTIAQTGGRLASPARWSFRTSTVRMKLLSPASDNVALNLVIVLQCNQRINAARVATRIKLSGARLRLASAEEIASDPEAKDLVPKLQTAHWLAIVPEHPLRRGTEYTLVVERGTPSCEGPLTTEADQRFNFTTYLPLRLIDHRTEANLEGTWFLQLNNPIDPASIQAERWSIQPELPGREIRVSGSHLMIRGRSRARGTYRVTIPAGLQDVFGQKLGRPESVTVSVADAWPSFQGPARHFVVLDPDGPRSLTCQVSNVQRLRVTAWRVQPGDWSDYQVKYLGHVEDEHPKLAHPPDWSKDIRLSPDQDGEVNIDVSPVLPTGLGHLVVLVEPLNAEGKQIWGS